MTEPTPRTDPAKCIHDIETALDELGRLVLATEDFIALRIAQRRIDKMFAEKGHKHADAA